MAATDQVSSTVLTYGLMPPGDDWPSRLLRERTLATAETHLTMRDLRADALASAARHRGLRTSALPVIAPRRCSRFPVS
jgi:hypothetical protein